MEFTTYICLLVFISHLVFSRKLDKLRDLPGKGGREYGEVCVVVGFWGCFFCALGANGWCSWWVYCVLLGLLRFEKEEEEEVNGLGGTDVWRVRFCIHKRERRPVLIRCNETKHNGGT